MSVLALDLASSCGYALSNGNGKIVDSGTVVFEGDDRQKLAALLSWLYGRCKDGLSAVVVEAPLPARAASNRLPIAMWGVAAAVSTVSGIAFDELHNATIKRLIAGSGKADKDLVRKSAERQSGVKTKTTDESDAIALAIAWRMKQKEEQLVV